MSYSRSGFQQIQGFYKHIHFTDQLSLNYFLLSWVPLLLNNDIHLMWYLQYSIFINVFISNLWHVTRKREITYWHWKWNNYEKNKCHNCVIIWSKYALKVFPVSSVVWIDSTLTFFKFSALYIYLLYDSASVLSGVQGYPNKLIGAGFTLSLLYKKESYPHIS
jgi:hypothetical protein